MVNVALEPPDPPLRPPRRYPKVLAILFLMLASAAGGFAVGRYGPGRSRVATTANPPSVSKQAATAPATAPESVAAAPTAVATATPPAAPAVSPPPTPGATTTVVQPAAPATTVAQPAAPAPTAVQPAAPGPAVPGPGTTSNVGWKRLTVTLNGPLEQSVANALPPGDRGLAEELTQMVNRLLVWHLRIRRDARKGDRLEVVYTLPSGDQSELVVQAVRYTSSESGRTFEALRYRPEGSTFARYYQPDGSEVEERLVDGPIAEYEQVTALLQDGRRHQGVDFKTPVGTPVTAPFDAVVVRRNWHFSANGNCLEIQDKRSGRHAIFLHLESVPKELRSGTQVRKGQLIAHSGNSGHSTAPHLHYQLESSNGRVLDPFTIHQRQRTTLQGANLAGFKEARLKLEELLTKG